MGVFIVFSSQKDNNDDKDYKKRQCLSLLTEILFQILTLQNALVMYIVFKLATVLNEYWIVHTVYDDNFLLRLSKDDCT